MAITPKPRQRANGTTYWRVQFREVKGGNPTAEIFETEEDALEFAHLVNTIGGARARRIRDAVDTAPDDYTLNDAFTDYAAAVSTYAQAGTVDRYKNMWNNHVADSLGYMPVATLTRQDIEQWVGQMRTKTPRRGPYRTPAIGKTLSGKTIKNVHTLISSALSLAVRNGRATMNVAEGVRLPETLPTRTPVFLTPAQLDAILAHVQLAADQLLIRVMAATGLRWGEATALTATDITFSETCTIRVNKAWKQAPGGPVVGPPKTRRSNRTVILPDVLTPVLERHVQTLEPGGLVFTAPGGGRVRHSTFSRRVWLPAVEAAKIDAAPRLHDLRHTHASWLISQGVPLPVIQRRLGHESIKTTVDRYGHLAAGAEVEAAAAANRMLN